jgi:hypothetical protein
MVSVHYHQEQFACQSLHSSHQCSFSWTTSKPIGIQVQLSRQEPRLTWNRSRCHSESAMSCCYWLEKHLFNQRQITPPVSHTHCMCTKTVKRRVQLCNAIETEDLPAEERGSECGSTAGKPRVPRQAFWMDRPQSSRFPTNLHHVNKCTAINTAIQHHD